MITGITLILAALAYYTGITLYKMQIVLPENAIYACAFLTLFIAVAIYPKKRNRLLKKWVYVKQKCCDFIVEACSSMILCAGVNNGDTMKAFPGVYGAALGLLYVLSLLVCTLSCNGSGFAATAVLVLGLAAVIWGSILLIKRIQRGPK